MSYLELFLLIGGSLCFIAAYVRHRFYKDYLTWRREKFIQNKRFDDVELLNKQYGGDWYWCEKRQKYADAATTRVATVEDA